ncbi:MAG: zinc-binding dehydrogenase [Fimbriimonadaceae bacterium]
MKAVVLRGPGDLALLDVPEPDCPPGHAVVRMTHCGICGSDVRYLRGDNPWAKQTLGEKRPNPSNIILGHEATGVVERVASDVDPAWVGKRVALIAFGTCGECEFCTTGRAQLCPNTQHLGHGAGWADSPYCYGGMAERVPILAAWLQELPDAVGNLEASVLDPLGVAVHGVGRTGVGAGRSLLIVGAGPVGVLAVPVARNRGATQVVVADLNESALTVSRKMGADAALLAVGADVQARALEANGGRPYDAILDTVGAPLGLYLPLLERGGTMVTMTVRDEAVPFPTKLLAGERTLTSSCNFRFDEYAEAVRLLETGAVDPSPMITHRYPLDDALEAFRVAENKDASGAVKVVLTGS